MTPKQEIIFAAMRPGRVMTVGEIQERVAKIGRHIFPRASISQSLGWLSHHGNVESIKFHNRETHFRRIEE